VLEDRTRRVSEKRGFSDNSEFIEQEVDRFLEGYDRCYVQDQENYVELWCEKDALSQVFGRVAWPFCIRTVTARGYNSISYQYEYTQRARAAMAQGQIPVILYFGDLDPSGWQALEATKQTLEEDFGLYGIDYNRVALNLDQVEEFNLPHSPDAVKEKDTRYRGYVKRFGNIAVELDALHPAKLEEMARHALIEQFDMVRFAEQMEIEKTERGRIASIKERFKAEFNRCLTCQT
jgi:uncharacterized protein YlbG (UPF0298 family)